MDAKRRLSGWPARVLGVVMMAAGTARSGEARFELADHLNVAWRAEMVHFPFTAPSGACRLDSARLHGPDGTAVPVQLSDVAFWPEPPDGRLVREATVSFTADLAPLERAVYTLTFGPTPAPPAPASDLVIRPGDGEVGVGHAQAGIRFATGGAVYDEPAPAEQVPGPVRRLRLADGTEFGGSRLFGPRRIRAWSGELVDSGPVFARARFVYEYEDGNVLTLHVRLGAGQQEIEWFTEVARDDPVSGFDLLLGEGLPPLLLHLQREFGVNRPVFERHGTPIRGWAVEPLAGLEAGRVTRLSPWADWWDNWTQTTLRLQPEGRATELHVERRNAGAWVEPAAPGTLRDWGRWHAKCVPLEKGAEGDLYLRVNNMGGRREWVLRESEPTEEVGWRAAQVIPERPRLDVVKDYVLEWPSDAANPHPRLYLSGPELDEAVARGPLDPERPRAIWPAHPAAPLESYPSHAYAAMLDLYLGSGRSEEVARQVDLVGGLERALARLGDFDKMRYVQTLLPLYDVVMATDLVTPEQRRVLRAQMAYLGYQLADSTWSIERGYRSYNFNMTVYYLLNLGRIGCLLADHPEAGAWTGQAVDNMGRWLDERVGPAGEFPESSSYTHASVSSLLTFAVAARRAGLHDFFAEGPFRRLGLFLAKQYTPADPFRRGWRVIPPVGRHTAGHPGGEIPGVFARATAGDDPEFSRIMQWTWNAMGQPAAINVPSMGGLEQWYLRADLPAAAPDWGSQFFPDLGVVLRQGVGTEDEHYVSIVTNPRGNSDIWAPELGGFVRWFFRGRPIGGAFAGGEAERHELLRSRVMPARSWTEGADPRPFGTSGPAVVNRFTALPRVDLVDVSYELTGRDDREWFPEGMPAWPPVERAGALPMSWRRQALYLKDATPAGPAYLVLRDTVGGGQPSMWQFWTLSEKLGGAEEAADREAFLADRPGAGVRPARRLEGDRFTAVGQLDADLEYFVAAPAATPRHTVRYGRGFHAYVTGQFEEYQDALHLQLPGDGHYFVALFPRLRDEPAPRFRALADGAVIAVEGAFGTDYAFLSDEPARAAAGEAVFDGTAGAVMDRPDGAVLALAAPGAVAFGDRRLACADSAVSLVLTDGAARLDLPEGHAGAQVTLTLPGAWTPDADGVTVSPGPEGTLVLRVPAGLTTVRLARP